MRGRRTVGLVAAALLASALAVSAGVGTAPVPAAFAAGLGAGGEYHPLTPTRIYDTRAPGINSPVGPIPTSPTGGTADVTILGQGGIPSGAADVLAVAVSITVVDPTKEGYLQVYPTGSTPGISSVVNYAAGQTVPNLTAVSYTHLTLPTILRV